MHLHFAWAWRLATTPRVLDAAQDLLGPNLLIWATELFAKHSRDGAVSIGWHRDGPYMGLDPARTVSAWIALSPSVRENGCMCVVREANRQTLRTKQPAPGDVIEEVTLSPGEMSLHDVHVLHGSQANRSDHKRVGFTIRFTTPEGRPNLELPPAVLARGEDRFGHFRLLQPPGESDSAASLEAMRRSARQHLDATLMNLKQAASSELPHGRTS
jgi:ectoine hydroxylase-related dioxygenase (phytanoyl-CoA dioxygenase family)